MTAAIGRATLPPGPGCLAEAALDRPVAALDRALAAVRLAAGDPALAETRRPSATAAMSRPMATLCWPMAAMS